MTRLVLVRHGESNSTVKRGIGGPRSCSGLSALGRRQAEALRDRWSVYPEIEPDVVIASHYRRAQETAEIVLPSLGETASAAGIVVDAGFGEHDPGPECDGLSFTEYQERYGGHAEAWANGDPYAITFPGGETVAAFQYRVGSALSQALTEHPDATVMVFCHGGVVDAVLRMALRAAPMGGFEIHTLNTSITDLVQITPSAWRLLRYNDTAHLAALPAGTTSIADR